MSSDQVSHESAGAGDLPGTPRAGSGGLILLRLVAIAGLAILLIYQATQVTQIQPRQGWGLLILLAACAAIGLTVLVMLSNAAGHLVRHPDLLIPLGLYLPAEALVGVLAALPALAAMFGPTWSLKLLGLNFSLSVGFVLQILLGIVFAGWTTVLIIQAVRQDSVEPGRALGSMGRWFLRVLIVEFLCWAILFAGLAVAIALSPLSIVLALVLIGGFSLFLNLTTAALLPVVVAEQRSLGTALREGLRASWANVGRWWLPVVAQMILLGWVTLIYVSYTENPRPGATTTHTKTNWSVNGFWTGGYENNCRWHTKLMEVQDAAPLPLITTLLAIVFTLLAVAIKIKIVTELSREATKRQEPPETALDQPGQDRRDDAAG